MVYPGGLASYTAPIDYYVHASLDGAETCDYGVTDAAVFAKASERLPGEVRGRRATFDTTAALTVEGAARISTPFVHVNFTPRDNYRFAFGSHLGIGGGPWVQTDGDLEVMSLRKQFVLSEDGTLLLIKRRYGSRGRTESSFENDGTDPARVCSAFTLRYGRRGQDEICDYVVLNREGAGVCLQVNGGTIDFVRAPFDGDDAWIQRMGLQRDVDNAMWRKLGARYSPGLGVTVSESVRESLVNEMIVSFQWNFGNFFRGPREGVSRRVGLRHFSPKCNEGPECAEELDARILYRPDSRAPAQYLPDFVYFER